MGKYKHHSGKVGGGVNLSKGKTPHDKDIKDMPLFRMGKPYEMGMSMRGPLDKHGMSQDHKMAYDRSEISRLKKDIHFDDLKKKSMGPSAYGKMKQGPLNQAKPDYIDIDGDGDKKESMKQAASQKGPEMRGPLNQTQQSGFRAMTKEEIAKLKAKKAAKKATKAASESAGQVLKTNVERKITKKQ
jgi:hypothetical protein